MAIKSAYGQLRISLNNLINSGHISKTQYSIEDFILLLKQFNFNLKPYSDQIQQLLIIKKMLIGDDYVKSKESYIAAIELLVDVMQANSMVENNHFLFEMKKPETKKNLTELVRSVLHIVKNSPLMKSDQFIKLQSVKELVKFENKLLSYENLLTIKVIIFGGNAEILTAQEVAQFETKTQGLIDSGYQISNILNQKNFKDFMVASPQLQQQINYLSEKTFIDVFLASREHSEKIYAFIENYLSVSAGPRAGGEPDYKLVFSQLADASTFSSKDNIIGFLNGVTALLAKYKFVIRLASSTRAC